MSEMEIIIDSPHAETSTVPQARIMKHSLLEITIRQSGLVDYVKVNDVDLAQLITAIFPTNEDAEECLYGVGPALETLFEESMVWLRWLMSEGDPVTALVENQLSQLNVGEGGFCGVVWKPLDMRYGCRTCELDPTCALCVNCFEGGNHRRDGHDYYFMPSAGGSCDCGDVTAMKSSGFCSKHKQMQPLPSEFTSTSSIGAVLDSLFLFWENKLVCTPLQSASREISEELTFVVVELILGLLCEHSESLRSFISEKMCSLDGLLAILVRVEQFFCSRVVERLHELLLKLLSEPKFKSKFATIYLRYYPRVVAKAIKEHSAEILKMYSLKQFSAQIFTVPTLTLPLVKENDLFSMLFKCLEDVFRSCAGVDGRLKTIEWSDLYEATIRVVEDIQFVMSHPDASIYVTCEKKDITRRWMGILSNFVQGMIPRKRGSIIDIEEQPFELGHVLAKIHSYLVGGAFSEEIENDPDSVRVATIPRISQESSVSKSKVAEIKYNYASIPSSVSWFTSECLRAIDIWLVLENSLRRLSSSMVVLDSEAGGSSFGGMSTKSLKVLSLREWPDIVYDVSAMDISAHIPLHRLLSTVLHRSIRKYATSGGILSTTSDNFFSHILGDCHPCGFSAFIMEHPLRIRVFCAQVRAGMWGSDDATLLTRGWYLHSVGWYENGLEHDLFLLQCCAAFAPEPDLYVKRILERYGLSQYLNPDLEQSIEHETVLVPELLTLIIQIVRERRFCSGQTNAHYIRREFINQLSVENTTYSELIDSIPKDLLENEDLPQILDSVAVYSNPAGLNKGMYELRLECLKELDLYHPRWDSIKLQKAEERYLRICSISAGTAQLPGWSTTYQPLGGIARVATCKTTLQILRTVLFYALFSEPSRAPEGVLRTALHFLSLALEICSLQLASGQREVIPILEFASEEFSSSWHGEQSLLSLLVILMRLHEKEKIESFAEAVHSNFSSLCGNILKKFAELEPKCLIKLQKIAPEVVSQVSECNSNLEGSMTGLPSDSEKRKAKARERQAAVMEKIKAEQSKFLEAAGGENLDAEDEGDKCCLCHDAKSPLLFLVHLQKSQVVSLLDSGPVSWDNLSQPGKNHIEEQEEHVYSLVRENCKLLPEDFPDLSIAGEERGSQSILLAKYIASISKEVGDSHPARNYIRTGAYDGFGPPDCDGIYLSSCRHAVHQNCLARYLSTLPNRIYVKRGHIVDPAKGEFLCPMCFRLACSVLPSSENVPRPSDPETETSSSSSTGEDSIRIPEAFFLMKSAASAVNMIKYQQSESQSSDLDPLIRVLCGFYFPNEGGVFESDRVSHPLLLWDVLKYSIASTEIASRSGERFSTPNYGFDSSNQIKSSSGFIMSLLLNIVGRSKGQNVPTSFLRYRGIHRFMESLFPMSSHDEKIHQEGDKLFLPENSNSETKFPDIQFWKRASDPVLARDSFSSLMWTLFCLPTSFLSSKESFFCLVHIFYLVTITQAIVICCRKQQCSFTKLGVEDCLIADICKIIGGSVMHFQYFDSKYIDSSYDIKDTTRILSSTFLRRCSLLWGLVNTCESFPFSHESSKVDLDEVERLELFFKIPPMDKVVNDAIGRNMATTWLHHFMKDFKPYVLYCTPSVPFSLVVLPDLYEHLLFKYNKLKCHGCGQLLEKTALCLLCGKLCTQFPKCSREIGCQTHAMACGAGTGVFLSIHTTSILLQSAARQATWPSPYLDMFGDEDIDVYRGRPLKLNKERYEYLAHMVVSHDINRRVLSQVEEEEE